MTDKPFYAHDKEPAAPRQPQPGEHVWTMTKGGHQVRAELRPRQDGLCELQLLVDGELRTAHLHRDREWALTEANLRREALRLRNWTPAS